MERKAAEVLGRAARQPTEAPDREIGGVRRRRERVGRQPDREPAEARTRSQRGRSAGGPACSGAGRGARHCRGHPRPTHPRRGSVASLKRAVPFVPGRSGKQTKDVESTTCGLLGGRPMETAAGMGGVAGQARRFEVLATGNLSGQLPVRRGGSPSVRRLGSRSGRPGAARACGGSGRVRGLCIQLRFRPLPPAASSPVPPEAVHLLRRNACGPGSGVFPHPQDPSGHPVSVPRILPADPRPQGGRVFHHRGHFSWNDRLRIWRPHGRTVSRTRSERHGTAGGSRSVERWMIQRWIPASGPSRSSAESAALIRKGLLSTIPSTSAENRWSASFRLRTSWSIAGLSFRSTPLPRA